MPYSNECSATCCAFFDRAAANIHGVTGTLSTPKTEHGVSRLDSVDAAGDYHVVTSKRLTTPDSLSGASPEVVVQVARSVWQPQGLM
jgi:hypothetical protein